MKKKCNDSIYCCINKFRIPKNKSKEQYGRPLDSEL